MSVTWGIHEVKVNQIINTQFLELQNDCAKVGAKDLWVSVVLHLILVCFLWRTEEQKLYENFTHKN